MIDAVFISDLHLHPLDVAITQRFYSFMDWASQNVKTVYILGDFFHAWPGDDALDDWSKAIAAKLAQLATSGVAIYYMHGNRDFLIGKRFIQLAQMTLLIEPHLIELGGETILLVHGDRYCTKDKSHQWLRCLTRNTIFPKFFLLLPYLVRAKIVNKVRSYSQMNRSKPMDKLDIVPSAMLKHMQELNVTTVIHGHIHKPGLTCHSYQGSTYRQYVLSDWDDTPLLMCYDASNGFYFELSAGD